MGIRQGQVFQVRIPERKGFLHFMLLVWKTWPADGALALIKMHASCGFVE